MIKFNHSFFGCPVLGYRNMKGWEKEIEWYLTAQNEQHGMEVKK